MASPSLPRVGKAAGALAARPIPERVRTPLRGEHEEDNLIQSGHTLCVSGSLLDISKN